MNRNLVYFIRNHLPENQTLHNKLAEKKLKSLRSMLIPMDEVRRGEEDPSVIPELVEKYEASRPGLISSLTKAYDSYLHFAGLQLPEDVYARNRALMLFDCMAYGFSPDEYSYYELSGKTPEEKKQYVTDLDRKMMQYLLSDFKQLQFVFDKTATYQKFRDFYKRDEICISKASDFEAFCSFAEKHDELVIKEVSNSSGRGVELEKTDREHLREQFEQILARGRCSIEERIIQSDDLSAFNPSSVNTARVMTFQTQSGPVIGPCFFRAGRQGSFVDNAGAGSGGILTGINRETGVLDTDGHDEYYHVYPAHPDSGKAFLGFQLPEWEQCIQMVKEMCALVPQIGYVGWDLAHTAKGWVIVEANGGSHMVNQLVYHQGCREEVEAYIRSRNFRGVDLDRVLNDGCYRSFSCS